MWAGTVLLIGLPGLGQKPDWWITFVDRSWGLNGRRAIQFTPGSNARRHSGFQKFLETAADGNPIIFDLSKDRYFCQFADGRMK